MVGKFTDLVTGESKPVDFAQCAEACFAGAAQGRSNQMIANDVDRLAGIASPEAGRSV